MDDKFVLFRTNYWTEPDIINLPIELSHLYLYFWTNPKINLSGIYEVTPDEISLYSKVPKNKLFEYIDKLHKLEKIAYNQETFEVALLNRLNNVFRSPNNLQLTRILNELQDVKDKSLIKMLKINKVQDEKLQKFINGEQVKVKIKTKKTDDKGESIWKETTFRLESDGSIKSFSEVFENKEIIADEEKPEKKKEERKIIPPSLKMVRDYCMERGNGINPKTFIDFYIAKDWLIGKNKMKDWQAAVRTWEQKNGFVYKDDEEIELKKADEEIKIPIEWELIKVGEKFVIDFEKFEKRTELIAVSVDRGSCYILNKNFNEYFKKNLKSLRKEEENDN